MSETKVSPRDADSHDLGDENLGDLFVSLGDLLRPKPPRSLYDLIDYILGRLFSK